jgi:hypothetical protein
MIEGARPLLLKLHQSAGLYLLHEEAQHRRHRQKGRVRIWMGKIQRSPQLVRKRERS